MPEDIAKANANETQGNPTPDAKKPEEKAPTVEELLTELARERAEKNKIKASFDKTASDVAELKRQLRAKQTVDEQALADQKEAEEKQAEYIKSLERKVAMNEAVQRYVSLGMDATLATDTATAELDGDRDKVTANFKKYQDAVIEAKQAEWLKSRPQMQSGGEHKSDDDLVKDAFMKALKNG